MYTLISGGVGTTPGTSCWGVLPGSLNPDAISDRKKAIFHTCFQTWPLNAYPFSDLACIGRNYVIITWIKPLIKRFLEINFEFAYYSFFLIHLQLKGQIRLYTPHSSLKKPYLIPDPNGQIL